MREVPVSGAETRDMIFAINQLIRGRCNATGTVTLAANTTSTTVANDNFNLAAVPILMPMTAAAATEMGNGTMFATIVTAGTLVITHANTASTTRTFGFHVVGG